MLSWSVFSPAYTFVMFLYLIKVRYVNWYLACVDKLEKKNIKPLDLTFRYRVWRPQVMCLKLEHLSFFQLSAVICQMK